MNNTIKNRIYLMLKALFWIVVIGALGLSIWYAVIISKDANVQNQLEKTFVKVWSIIQTFMVAITLPLTVLKIYTTVNALVNGAQDKKRYENKINNKRKDIIMSLLKQKNPIKVYLKSNSIKTNEDRFHLILYATSFVRRLEGIALIDLGNLMNSYTKKDSEFLRILKQIMDDFNPNIWDNKNFKEALKYI